MFAPTTPATTRCWSRGWTISARAPPAARCRAAGGCWAGAPALARGRWPMPENAQSIAHWPYGTVFSLDGVTPQIAEVAFIAPTAAIIGDVVIGSETGIWFHCL